MAGVMENLVELPVSEWRVERCDDGSVLIAMHVFNGYLRWTKMVPVAHEPKAQRTDVRIKFDRDGLIAASSFRRRTTKSFLD